MSHSCDDCTRAGLLRSAADAGLPNIEAGMPAPAGTGLSRRSFMVRSLGLGLAVYGAGKLSFGEADIAQAASGPPGAIVIQVYLEGGVDALNVLAPTNDPTYRRLRPTLALAPGSGTPFTEDPRLNWHPSAAGIAQLHREGKVSVLPAVGYTHPDQSHFVSRHFYEVGALNPDLRVGWMGRYLDRVGDHANPLQGLSLDGSLAPALATQKVPVASIDSPGSFDFWARDVWGEIGDMLLPATASLGRAHAGSDPALRQAGAAAVQAAKLRDQLLPFAPKGNDDGTTTQAFTSPVQAEYPTTSGGNGDDDFPNKLKGLAAMIAAGLPMRCVSITAPGSYDTHSDEAGALGADLKLTCDTLLAFQHDLEARGLADRVIVNVWSEFGRRAEENGGGTDHGAAGLGLVIGSRVTGRMIGEWPGVDRLDADGNLIATSDFRAVYAALLEQWLDTDAGAVLPDIGSMARPVLIA